MAKRTATSELNHDNWNEEEEPEEAGTFQKASAEELKKRVIKTAKRKNPGLGNGSTKSAFAGFGGFGSTASIPKAANFTFGLGNNSSSSSSNGIEAENSTPASVSQSTPTNIITSSVTPVSKSTNSEGTSSENSHSREYYAQLKGLNESVSSWIKSHVDKNPICILTPIFRDYEHHLINIEASESRRTKDNLSEGSSKLIQQTEKAEKSTDNTFSFTLGSKSPAAKPSTSSNTTTTIPSFFGSPGSAPSSTPASILGSGFTFGKKLDDAKDTSIKNEVNPFLSGSKETFNFGQAQSSVGGTNASFPSAGFTFGGSSTFSFLNPAKTEAKPDEEKTGEKDEDEDDAPKDEFKPIIEDDAIYTKRCKLFVKKEGKFNECGVGTLHIKPVTEEEEQKRKKIQVVVRADNAIGTVLLNVLYGGSSSLPTPTRVGKNNVMLVCPLPSETDNKPLPVLVRVKEASDADELLKHLTDIDK